MKHLLCCCAVILFLSCDNNNEQQSADAIDSASIDSATKNVLPDTIRRKRIVQLEAEEDSVAIHPPAYNNKRFKDVQVQELSIGKFKITGKAQVFEASFNWHVTEDGRQIMEGYQNTDAGAPEFGNFNFNITIKRKSEHSKVVLTLYEASANDGSPQHQLIIPLY